MWRWLASGQTRFRRQMSIQPRGSKPVYALLSFLCFPFISRYSLRGLWKSVTNTRVCTGGEGEGSCVTGWSIRVSKVRLSPRIKPSRRMYTLVFEICISPLSAPIRGKGYLGHVRSNRSILMETNGYSCFLAGLGGGVTKRRITRWFNSGLISLLGLANSWFIRWQGLILYRFCPRLSVSVNWFLAWGEFRGW